MGAELNAAPMPVPTEHLIEEALGDLAAVEGMGAVCDALKAARSELAEFRMLLAVARLDHLIHGRLKPRTFDRINAVLNGVAEDTA